MPGNYFAPYWVCPVCGVGKSWLILPDDHAVHHPEKELPRLQAAYNALNLEQYDWHVPPVASEEV